MGYITLENSLSLSIQLEIHIPQDPAIPLLAIYASEKCTYLSQEIHRRFIAAVHIPAQTGNNPTYQR